MSLGVRSKVSTRSEMFAKTVDKRTKKKCALILHSMTSMITTGNQNESAHAGHKSRARAVKGHDMWMPSSSSPQQVAAGEPIRGVPPYFDQDNCYEQGGKEEEHTMPPSLGHARTTVWLPSRSFTTAGANMMLRLRMVKKQLSMVDGGYELLDPTWHYNTVW